MDQSVDLDVDNLFSEENLNQATLDQDISLADHTVLQPPNPILPPGLIDRIAHLTQNGCLNSVAWSRQGHIAKIVNDGTAVELQCQRYNTKTNQWQLTEPTLLESTFDQATSLAWSPSGVDLAVADTKGRLAIFSMTTTCLNRLKEARGSLADQPDEMGVVIAMLWLNQDKQGKPKTIIQGLKKDGDRWSHTMLRGRALPPLYHRAVVLANQVGSVALLYQRPDGQYRRISKKLPVPSASVYTHAAIAPTVEGKLLVILHSTDGMISAYFVGIVWPDDLRTNLSSEIPPTINVQIIDNQLPSLQPYIEQNGTTSNAASMIETLLLTHLEIVPTSEILPDQGETEEPRLNPIVNAVYTPYHQGANAADPGFLQPSMIRRWMVKNVELKLHSRFNDIQSTGGGVGENTDRVVVERLPDVNFAQVISSLQGFETGSTIAITTQDARTELWNPSTMSPIMYEPGSTAISSMVQAGFSFPASMSAIVQCLSANACAVVTVDLEGNLSVSRMAFEELSQQPGNSKPQTFDPPNNTSHDAAIASYILVLARSCWNNSNADDILSSIHATIHQSSLHFVTKTLYLTLCKPTEFISERMQGSELSQVAQKPLDGKVLSFHMVLHKNSSAAQPSDHEFGAPRDAQTARLWVWLSINLRHTTTVLYLFYQSISPPRPQPGQPEPPLPPLPPDLPPSYIDMICNNIRWSFSVFNFLLQSILEVGDRQSHPDMFEPPSFETLLGDEKGDGSQGLVALLLSCNWSRIFLVTLAKILRAFLQRGGQSRGAVPGTPLGRVVNTIQQCVDAHGLSLAAIEILADPRWYVDTPDPKTGWQPDSIEVMNRQVEMMSTGVVPEVYQGTVKKVLEACLNGGENPSNGLRSRGEIDRLKLLQETPDRAWLLLNMDDIAFQKHTPSITPVSQQSIVINGTSLKGSAGKPPRRLIDVHKKAPITFNVAEGGGNGLQDIREQIVRRCVRCGSVSEDIDGMDRSWPRNMVQFMARCVCDGHWVLEKFGDGI